jgi:long-chain acyl-CoA synthetase
VDLDTSGSLSTLPEVFDSGYALSKNSTFLGHRPIVSKSPTTYAHHYVWQTYAEVDERRRHVGSALHTLFEDGTVGGGEYPTVGLWSPNRPEWVIVELALNAYGKVGVSLYDTLGDEAVEYIIDHAHLTVIFTTSGHLATLLRAAPRHPHLRLVVVIDELEPETKRFATAWSQTLGVKLQELHEFEKFGEKHRRDIIKSSPSDLATLCYTSGTTSIPKGVLLTHGNLAISAQSNLYGYSIDTERVTLLSYLPLAHIYERINQLAVIALGGSIGFFTGDPLRLLEDAQVLKPNYFPAVPRVLNRIYQAAMVAGNVPGLKGAIFRRAVQTKLDNLHSTGVVTHPLWDRLVFKKIQTVLGGNVKLVVSGSAPISVEVLDFLKIALACDVYEGYGMTENCALCTRGLSGDPTSSGTVGPPQPAAEMKLVDVPGMNYTAEDKPFPRGEICCRGPGVFTQYYKDEKKNRGNHRCRGLGTHR